MTPRTRASSLVTSKSPWTWGKPRSASVVTQEKATDRRSDRAKRGASKFGRLVAQVRGWSSDRKGETKAAPLRAALEHWVPRPLAEMIADYAKDVDVDDEVCRLDGLRRSGDKSLSKLEMDRKVLE